MVCLQGPRSANRHAGLPMVLQRNMAFLLLFPCPFYFFLVLLGQHLNEQRRGKKQQEVEMWKSVMMVARNIIFYFQKLLESVQLPHEVN